MIRRSVGREWWLFTQDDHARLAGALAAQLGGLVAPLTKEAIAAVAMHDAGWIDTDASPKRTGQGHPIDVFETSIESGLPIWRRSSTQAHETLGDYGGLLVSCHSLALSAFAAQRSLSSSTRRATDMKLHFLINKLQHAEIELQEQIRRRLDMRLDAPLTLGLALESIEPREQQLIYDYRWLAAMDQLSLNLCCTAPPFPAMPRLSTSPGTPEIQLSFSRIDHSRACVHPWPFGVEPVRASISFRRLPDTPFLTDQALQQALLAATIEVLPIEILPTGPLAAIA